MNSVAAPLRQRIKRLADAHSDSLSSIVAKAGVLPSLIEILNESDEVIGHDSEEAVIDQRNAITMGATKLLARKLVTVVRESHAAIEKDPMLVLFAIAFTACDQTTDTVDETRDPFGCAVSNTI